MGKGWERKEQPSHTGCVFPPQIKQSTSSICSETFLIWICFPHSATFLPVLLCKSHWKGWKGNRNSSGNCIAAGSWTKIVLPVGLIVAKDVVCCLWQPYLFKLKPFPDWSCLFTRAKALPESLSGFSLTTCSLISKLKNPSSFNLREPLVPTVYF